MHFELMLADQCGGGRLLCHLRLCCSIHHHRTWAVPWRQTTSQHSMSLMNKRQVATKPKSEDATGIISFRQRFLSGNFDDFFGVPLFGSSPKTEAKGLQKIGQCVSWGELRPALWVFWIPQGCTKTMLHIIKGIETRHPTSKLSWKWTLYQTLSCTSWVYFPGGKSQQQLNITFHISSESSFPMFYLWWHLHSALMFYESAW